MTYLRCAITSTESQRYSGKGFRAATASSHGKRTSMEDTHVVQLVDTANERLVLAVFDGHGGDWAALQAEHVFPSQLQAAVQAQTHDNQQYLESEEDVDDNGHAGLLSKCEIRQVFSKTDAQLRSQVDGDPDVRAKRRALCIDLSRWQRAWDRMVPLWQHYRAQQKRLSLAKFSTHYYSRRHVLLDEQHRMDYRFHSAYTNDFSSRKMQPNWGVHARDETARIEIELANLQLMIDLHDRLIKGYDAYIQAYMDHCGFVCDQVRRLKSDIQSTFDGQINHAGCTAATVELNLALGELRMAHLGDSRVLVYNETGELKYWTEDHKPEDEDEYDRIDRAGSEVTRHEGCYRVDGNLNMTRALADFRYKACELLSEDEQPISGVPAVSDRCHVSPGDFIVVCCDGIFECGHFDNHSLGSTLAAYQKLHEDPEAAALHVLDICAKHGTHDNQTIIVLTLREFDQHDQAYSRPVVYRPMAVTNPKVAFTTHKWDFAPVSFAQVLAAECQRHGLTLRQGLLKGTESCLDNCTPDMLEFIMLLTAGIQEHPIPAQDDVHLIAELQKHYKLF